LGRSTRFEGRGRKGVSSRACVESPEGKMQHIIWEGEQGSREHGGTCVGLSMRGDAGNAATTRKFRKPERNREGSCASHGLFGGRKGRKRFQGEVK